MSKQLVSECPQPEILVQFLQGKLYPPQLVHCEDHLKDCEVCHDTLYGLNTDDTLTERLAEVFSHQQAQNSQASVSETQEASGQIENLLKRLKSEDFKRSALADGHGGVIARTPEMEIVADRAAEVLRCVTPTDDSLGVLGDYTLIRLIGAGSAGVVFEAVDQTLDRTVALKILRPSLGEIARNRFVIEGKLAASIEHPNVVTIFQVGQVDRLAYMAMPWLPGQTLETMLASDKQLSKDEIIEIVRQVAAGLDAAHQKQLVHRDIKPANLWICEKDQTLKILDFGLARINDENPSITATGMLAGTPGFMSPEQSRGLELDGRSDLFSLGCVMYRLLSGKAPFGAPTVLATLSAIQSDHPTPPGVLNKDVDSDLSDIAMCLLEKQPFNRPQSALQTIELLTTPRKQWPLSVSAYKTVGVSADRAPDTQVASASGNGSRRWGTWTAALIASLLLGGLGWMFAPQIIRIATDQGEIVIETTDDDVEIQVLQNGKKIQVIDTKTQQSFSLKSGQYTFNAVATGDTDGESNTFAIEPKKLTMRRGDSAIVSVTLLPSKEPNKATDVASSVNPGAKSSLKTKPSYKGKVFDQWINVAKFDRDRSSRIEAMRACNSTAEAPEERRQLLRVTSTLARKHGGERLPRMVKGYYENSYLYVLYRVLNACNDDQVIEFIRTEITEGNANSRGFCTKWLNGTVIKSEKYPPYIPHPSVSSRAGELTYALAENLKEPGVVELATAIISFNDQPVSYELIKELRSSELGEKVKKFVQTAPPQQRYKMFDLALHLFANDPEVLNVYINDLFNPELANAMAANRPYHRTELAVSVRLSLFLSVLQRLAPTYPKIDVADIARPDPETEASNLVSAAELLASVVDWMLTDVDQRLVFSLSSPRRGSKEDYTAEYILQYFHNVGQRCNDDKVKQALREKLGKLKDSIVKDLIDKPKTFGQKSFPSRVDYVMARLAGAPRSPVPEESYLRNDPVFEETEESQPASPSKVVDTPKTAPQQPPAAISSSDDQPDPEKPIYQGKPFKQWYKIARVERDAKLRSNALYACMVAGESNAERQQVLDLIRPLIRKDGIQFISKGYAYWIDQKKLWKFCGSCDGNLIFDFIKAEVVDGTEHSRQFCSAWLILLYSGVNPDKGSAQLKEKLSLIEKRTPELVEVVTQHLEEPAMIHLAMNLFLSLDAGPSSDILRNSLLREKVRELVQTGSPQLKLELFDLAFETLPYDAEILKVYQDDLLNSKLNSLIVRRRDLGVKKQQYRYALLQRMLRRIEWINYARPNIDQKKKAKRVAAEAKLLQKFVDGFLAEDDERLIGFKNSSRLIRGEWTREQTPFKSADLTNELLKSYGEISKYLVDKTIDDQIAKMTRQASVGALNKLKASVMNQTTKSNRTEHKELVAKVDDVIAKLQVKPALPDAAD